MWTACLWVGLSALSGQGGIDMAGKEARKGEEGGGIDFESAGVLSVERSLLIYISEASH